MLDTFSLSPENVRALTSTVTVADYVCERLSDLNTQCPVIEAYLSSKYLFILLIELAFPS